MKPQTVKLPAFLASALVNSDESGLTCSCKATRLERDPTKVRRADPKTWVLAHNGGCDFRWLAAALAYCAPGDIVSAEGEAYFSWSCDLPGFTKGADMLDYVVLYPEGT